MAEKPDKPAIPSANLALRVNQFDASASDDYIYDVVINRVKDVFKHLHISSKIADYEPEIQALIKTGLWLFILRKHSFTLGQQMLALRYTSTRAACIESSLPPISKIQSVLYLVINVLVPWLHQRTERKFEERRAVRTYPNVHRALLFLNSLFSALRLANLLVFLVRGKYMSLSERILGIQSIHPEGRQLRNVSFELSNREILWHGFAEFMVFAMPLINTSWWKSIFTSAEAASSLPDSAWCCRVCEDCPTNPSQIPGCCHVYCYHCLVELIHLHGDAKCTSCKRVVTSYDDIEPAVRTVN